MTSLISLGAWKSFFDLSSRPDVPNTLWAILWFSLLGTFFFLGAVVWQKVWLRSAGAFFLFLPGVFFTHTPIHILVLVLSGGLAFLSMRSIQIEMNERTHFRFRKNVRVGSFTFILGLSLALSSAYFASIETSTWEELVPRFGVGEETASVVFKTIGYFYPEFQKLSEEGMTVDGFLESLQENTEMNTEMPSVPPDTREMQSFVSTLPELAEYLKKNAELYGIDLGDDYAHELYLRSGRQQISTMVGREVRGDEKIADVFSFAIQKRIIAALSAREATEHISPQIVPAILSILLFLTLLPVGSLLSGFWALLGYCLFQLALLSGFVKIIKIPLEKEGLEQ